MNDDAKTVVDAMERIAKLRNSLIKAESFIRSGNLIYANREICNIYIQLERGEIFSLDENGTTFADNSIAHKLTSIMFSLKRSVGFLQSVVNADAEMQRTITLAAEVYKVIVGRTMDNGDNANA